MWNQLQRCVYLVIDIYVTYKYICHIYTWQILSASHYLSECGCNRTMSITFFGYMRDLAKSWTFTHNIYPNKMDALRWRHNGGDSVSNRQPHDCLHNGLCRRRSKKAWKLRVTGLCAGNSPGTGEFPAQMASNAENASIWWRHHDLGMTRICSSCCPFFRLLPLCVSNMWLRCIRPSGLFRWSRKASL